MGDAPVVGILLVCRADPVTLLASVNLGVTAEKPLAREFQIKPRTPRILAHWTKPRARVSAAQADGRLAPSRFVPGGGNCLVGGAFDSDEGPRRHYQAVWFGLPVALSYPDTDTVTAGNSGGLGDAAAALVLAREVPQGHRSLARIVAMAQSGVDPARMGYGPVLAVRKLLARTGLTIDDFDLIESNEAFAAQALVVAQELGFDHARANLDGGAIAHGHPVGATGAILTVKAAHGLARAGRGRALVAMCVGGGQGIALALEAA